MSSATDEFRAARDFLLAHRTDYVTAYAKFRWPRPERFNFAIDWFDAVLAAERPNHTALRIIEADGTDESYSFGALSERSDLTAVELLAMISALPRPRPGARGTNPDLDMILGGLRP